MLFSGQITVGRAIKKLALAVVVLAGTLSATVVMPALAREATPEAPHNLQVVALNALPPEAQRTHRLILAGGPFPYRKDGSVFGNRERLLPLVRRGFYREYTVKTPGLRHRGARRIVCGGLQAAAPEACFFTADHYASFKLIAP